MDTAHTLDPRRWQALALVCVAFFMTVLDVSIVNVALPSIKTSLHVSENTLQWVLIAYTITFGDPQAAVAPGASDAPAAYGLGGRATQSALARIDLGQDHRNVCLARSSLESSVVLAALLVLPVLQPCAQRPVPYPIELGIG
jgi:hypothetical protein